MDSHTLTLAMYAPPGIISSILNESTSEFLTKHYCLFFKDFSFLLTEEGFEVQKLLFNRVCNCICFLSHVNKKKYQSNYLLQTDLMASNSCHLLKWYFHNERC